MQAAVIFRYTGSERKNVPLIYGQQGFYTCDINPKVYQQLSNLEISFQGIPVGNLFNISSMVLTIGNQYYSIETNSDCNQISSTLVTVVINEGLGKRQHSSKATLIGVNSKITINIGTDLKHSQKFSRVRIVLRPCHILPLARKVHFDEV